MNKGPYRCGIAAGIALLSLLTLVVVAAAQPSITSAKIRKKELKGLMRVTVIKTDLTRERQILIVGEADGGAAGVEKVEVSLDAGHTWREATGRQRWQYRFMPTPNYTYPLTVRVTDATGVVSDPSAFGLTQLTYLPLTLVEFTQQTVDELARAYMSKNLERYMSFISRDYQNFPRGWHRLRRAIQNDFKSLNNIIVRFTVNQVYELEERVIADIHWRLTYAGLAEPKEGFVEIHFDPMDQLKIVIHRKDLYFGAAPIGTDARIQITTDQFNNFVFRITDRDRVGVRLITARVRITGTVSFNGNVTLTETPAGSGRFVGSRTGAFAVGDRITVTYRDEITSDWRRNVRRTATLSL